MLKINTIILNGCSSRPMSNYLKALAVLRLISEQLDSNVLCHWREATFVLQTNFDKEEIVKYFCAHYVPTPLTAPWNGGSGFYPGDNIVGMNAIKATADPRFDLYKEVIETICSWPEIPTSPQNVNDIIGNLRKAIDEAPSGKKQAALVQLLAEIEGSATRLTDDEINPLLMPIAEITSFAKRKTVTNRPLWNQFNKAVSKARTECSRLSRSGTKEQILAACRNRLPDSILPWVDAVFALNTAGEAFFNPILGTGANEGRLDFTNNFMQRTTELLLTMTSEKRESLLRNALFGDVVCGFEDGKIGQYDPGRSGGFNQGTGIETKDFVINPWNFVFALEGSLIFASSMACRGSAASQVRLSAPFCVRFSPYGFISGEFSEAGRGEIWLPLWEKPAGLAEIKQLFGEGRSVVGNKPARTGIDFSRALSTLGVDRGLSAFERYAFLQRRGQSYVALPAGRFQVKYKKSVELLTELDPILQNLDQFLRSFVNIPAPFLSARKQIDDALFACSTDGSSHSFQRLIRAIGKMEQLIAQRDRSKEPKLVRPLHGLSLDWIKTCDTGQAEHWVAAAIASIGHTGNVGSIRSYLSGVSPKSSCRWNEKQHVKFWFGSNLSERLGGLLMRRQMDAERFGTEKYPLFSCLSAQTSDVMAFLHGETDDVLLEELLWGYTLIDWEKINIDVARSVHPAGNKVSMLSRTWCLLKLLHHQYLGKSVFRLEPRIGQLLQANRITDACSIAIHRLKVSERHPFNVVYEDDLDSARLLASLIIPVSSDDINDMELLVLAKNNKQRGF